MRDSKVVRHDVDDHAEPGLARTDHEPFQRLRPAAVMIDTGDISRVVTMIRTDRRLKYW